MMLTALVRDLALRYAGKVQLAVDTYHNELFQGNPHLTLLDRKQRGVETHVLEYRNAIQQAGHGAQHHFLWGFYKDFTASVGLAVTPTLPKPDLHLSDVERTERPVPGRYWVMMAGGKKDVPIKHWSFERYQLVADALRSQGLVVVQAGAAEEKHVNASLTGVVNLVGQTNLRRFLQLIYHAEGVIGPVTAAMHAAAAFDKPCVVIAGGREESWWEWYGYPESNFGPDAAPVKVPHRFFHTIGSLDCGLGNIAKGCWKKQVVKLTPRAKRLCTKPEYTPGGQPIAHCMNRTTEHHVVDAVMSYYLDHTLPPITARFEKDDVPLDVGASQQSMEAATGTITRPMLEFASVIPQLQALPGGSTAEVPELDHPLLGGRITFCTLLYGEHYDLHVRCLESLQRTVPTHRLADVRIGLNAVGDKTRRYLNQYIMHQLPVTLFDHKQNDLKYPVMREMFHAAPITTPYTVWWDDDTYAADNRWLTELAKCIIDKHPSGHRLFGINFRHKLRSPTEAAWFKAADWYKKRPFQTRQRTEAPNGDSLYFVSGGFFAIHTPVIYAANIPDVRLAHNGGDITIGEQVHQAGGKIAEFNTGKKFVFSSGAPPRGASQSPQKKDLLWRPR